MVALLYSAIHRLYFDPPLNKQSNNQGLFMPNHLSLFFSLLQQVLLRSSLVSSAVAFLVLIVELMSECVRVLV